MGDSSPFLSSSPAVPTSPVCFIISSSCLPSHPATCSAMAISQQWRHVGLLMAVTVAVLLIGSADAWDTCPSGFKNCDPYKPGCETCIQKDVNNCGDCGKKCQSLPYTTVKCENGQCKYTCTSGWANCDNNWSNGCETDIGKDAKNCGSCGYCCKQVPYAVTKCSSGKCGTPVCVSGWGNCDNNIWNGCETDIGKDVKNCGSCGNCCKQVPYAVTKCSSGKCQTPVCVAGWANCDNNIWNGCETDIGKDVKNCGKCGNCCTTSIKGAIPTCSNGKCGWVCKQGTKYDQKSNCCVPTY